MSLQASIARLGLLTLTGMTCLATTVACGGGAAPELDGLSDQVAQVGTELKITLDGTDPDGDRLTYGFHAGDLTDLDDRTSVSVSPSGSGVFRWTPNAMDVGQHSFDFTVDDGSNTTTETITIDVRSAIGSATAPIFRQPLGTGTTMDMTTQMCVDLDIVVEDQDTAQINISQEEPAIEGAELTQVDGTTATWHWCPTRDQQSESRYTLTLAADDGDNPKTIKSYLIVLRGSGGMSCAGTAPVIAHTPANESTSVDLTIDARVTDDKGLKDVPLFYYSLTQPPATPNLSTMTQLSMLQIDGTSTNGTYAADVPNPVASMPAGTSKKLYYVIVADDDDDQQGTCDHSTISQVYTATITSSGPADQPLCSTCTADSQCGDGDLCVYIGSMGASYCLQDCAASCPTNYACSASELWSVDGDMARQCVPSSGSCVAPTAACVDDTNEEDDTRVQAQSNATSRGPLGAGQHDFTMCPNSSTSGLPSDDDWFQIKVTTDALADLWLYGNGESDLDLHLYKSDGAAFSQSTSLEADENIKKCLPTGTYYARVNGWDRIRSDYYLDYTLTPQSCTTTCVDDTREDDDTYSQARVVTAPYTSTANVSCPNDDDWYAVTLFTGDVLTLDLTFTQSTPTGDLDFHLYQGDFNDLWPCSFESPSTCTSTHGQGGSSNEHATYTVPAGCTAGCDYNVVVRGYHGSTNTYGIAIKVE